METGFQPVQKQMLKMIWVPVQDLQLTWVTIKDMGIF